MILNFHMSMTPAALYFYRNTGEDIDPNSTFIIKVIYIGINSTFMRNIFGSYKCHFDEIVTVFCLVVWITNV